MYSKEPFQNVHNYTHLHQLHFITDHDMDVCIFP